MSWIDDLVTTRLQDNGTPVQNSRTWNFVGGAITVDPVTGIPTLDFTAGAGDVVGPASATNRSIALFNTTTGKLIQDSLVTITVGGDIVVPAGKTVDGRDISVDGTKLDKYPQPVAKGDMLSANTGGAAFVVTSVGVDGQVWTADSTAAGGAGWSNGVLETRADVRNETGALLSRGTIVYTSGYNVANARPLIDVADNTDPAKRPAIGVLTQDLANNSNGSALVSGTLRNVNTSSFSLTDQLVLGSAGTFVRPPPDNATFTGEVQHAGSVDRVDATAGEILVQFGGLEDVHWTTAAAKIIKVAGDDHKVGFGTGTVPHGGIGAAKLAIEGPDASTSGPHLQWTTAADDYPLVQIRPWQHDEISISFDAYNDGTWKSADAGSNFQIRKTTDQLDFNHANGIAQGVGITWQTALAVRTNPGRVSIDQAFSLNNNITPPTLSADQDDYNPTGLATCNSMHVSATGPTSITGLQAPSPEHPQVILVVNVGSSNITLSNNDANSLAANRFLFGSSITLNAEESMVLKYDTDNDRWRAFSNF